MMEAQYMDRALALAALGGRSVMPNPMVGAVLVRDGEILGEGHHRYFGGPHAEVEAIPAVSDQTKIRGATLYVTLEPCAHFGKTPPCTNRIIKSGIAHVVVACRDPFPEVAGRGIDMLRSAGIGVTEGVREYEATQLNKRFMVAHRLKRPYTILKWAQTDDGFLARSDGSSKWISCDASRNLTHEWRAQELAILVGTKTARIDNPSLTVRHVVGPNPVRAVIDASLSLPNHYNLFTPDAETIVFNDLKDEQQGNITYRRLDFRKPIATQIAAYLYNQLLISLLVEGGASTLNRFIEADAWDEMRVFVSPKKFGSGIRAPTLPQTSYTTVTSGDDNLLTFERLLL
jgi:diaminohydroxyphosphoribosylaminopyrimidine deaminase/5-amino-6-(5-phosphoribosylamino)uracil reductase